jgi:hypothetical protein
MKWIVWVGIVVPVILIVGATRLDGRSRDWRDGIGAEPIALSTGTVVSGTATVEIDSVLLSDQTRLAEDLRSAGGADNRIPSAIRETGALIADLQSSAVSDERRRSELDQALQVTRRWHCANCTSMLLAAGRSESEPPAPDG